MDPSASSLSRNREKRSTAGNRMQALLAGEYELEQEEVFMEVENDEDFIGKDVDDDVYDEDFQDTDEEEGEEDAYAGENVIQREEKEARKAARAKLSNLPRIRLMLTKKSASSTGRTSASPMKKRKVSLGVAVNAETGEVLSTRSSKRTATVIHTQETKSRILSANTRRAKIQKRVKVPAKTKTQDELIREALELEDQNTKSLQEFLSREEEKRKQARIVRPQVKGPMIRWVSRTEEQKTAPPQPQVQVMVSVDIPLRSSSTQRDPKVHSSHGIARHNSPIVTISQDAHCPSEVQEKETTSNGPNHLNQPSLAISSAHGNAGVDTTRDGSEIIRSNPTTTKSLTPSVETTNPRDGVSQVPNSHLSSNNDTVGSRNPSDEQSESSVAGVNRDVVKQAVNYIVLQLGEGATRRAHMEAMFGKHTNWSKAAVIEMQESRRKAVSTHSDVCPLSGLKAKYYDNRSGIPYANARGHKTITELLNNKFVWSSRLGCYVNHEDDQGAKGVPAGWNRAVKYGGPPPSPVIPSGSKAGLSGGMRTNTTFQAPAPSTSGARLHPTVVIPTVPSLSHPRPS